MGKTKRITLGMIMSLLLILNFASCNSEEKIMTENREFVGITYIEAGNYINLFEEDAHKDSADNLIKLTKKDKFVKWTGHITKLKDDNTIYLKDGNLAEVQAKFYYSVNKEKKYKEGDLITVSGNSYEYGVEGVFKSSYWYITNCRIEETTEEDKKGIDDFLKSIEDSKQESEGKNGVNSTIEESKIILGSTRDKVHKMFADYKTDDEYVKNVDANAVKFVNENLIVVIDFDSNGKAEGVSFLSKDAKDDGKNSYVNKHYDELIKLAAGGNDVKVEKNVTTKYPIEIYIGNVH